MSALPKGYVNQYRVELVKDGRVKVDSFINLKSDPSRLFKCVEMLPTWMQEAMALLFVMNTGRSAWVSAPIDGVGSLYHCGAVFWLDVPTTGITDELGNTLTEEN